VAGARAPPATVLFHLYLVSGGDDAVVPTRTQGARVGAFDYVLWQKELAKLQLPGQQFRFIRETLTLADEPALAAAFWTSLHLGRAPDGALRFYLDAEHLQHQLVAVAAATADRASSSGSSGRWLRVPVFLFLAPLEQPVLIDWNKQVCLLGDVAAWAGSRLTRGRGGGGHGRRWR
jgi:hypothetical protein